VHSLWVHKGCEMGLKSSNISSKPLRRNTFGRLPARADVEDSFRKTIGQATRLAIAHSTRNFVASTARCCSSAVPPTRRRPRGVPHRHRGREATGYSKFSPARGALPCQALSIDRPPRCPRAGARRLLTDAGNAQDRRGAGTDRAFGVGRFGGEKYFALAMEWWLWLGLRSFPRRPL
jgi:hypothetical protein